MTKDEMKAICREYALRHSNEHAYLPQNITQAETWEPHLWVLAAMEAALAAAVAAERAWWLEHTEAVHSKISEMLRSARKE